MKIVLKKETIKFIQSLNHDDLVCFLQVYGKATNPLDIAQCNAIRKEIKDKLEKENTELWDKE